MLSRPKWVWPAPWQRRACQLSAAATPSPACPGRCYAARWSPDCRAASAQRYGPCLAAAVLHGAVSGSGLTSACRCLQLPFRSLHARERAGRGQKDRAGATRADADEAGGLTSPNDPRGAARTRTRPSSSAAAVRAILAAAPEMSRVWPLCSWRVPPAACSQENELWVGTQVCFRLRELKAPEPLALGEAGAVMSWRPAGDERPRLHRNCRICRPGSVGGQNTALNAAAALTCDATASKPGHHGTADTANRPLLAAARPLLSTAAKLAVALGLQWPGGTRRRYVATRPRGPLGRKTGWVLC